MKAEGGWGTIAVQITEIAPDSDIANRPMERLRDDSDILRHAAQVEAIKRHGSLAAIELGHGGMRSRNMTTGLSVIGSRYLPVLRPVVPLHAAALDLAGIPALLTGLQAIYRNKATRTELFRLPDAHVLPGRRRDTGRPGMDLWAVLVMGILKQGLRCDYDRLQELTDEHGTIRQMLGVADDSCYALQNIRDNVELMTPELLGKVNSPVVGTATRSREKSLAPR